MWDVRDPSAWRAGRRTVARGETSGFHILASPPGQQAPVQYINYTPSTNEVHNRGTLAPVDQLNYTLVPTADVPNQMPGAGVGGRSMGGQIGFGAGQSAGQPPLNTPTPIMPGQENVTGRYGVPGTMASGQTSPGQPPTAVNPYDTGPGVRLSSSGPTPADFGTRSHTQGVLNDWGMGSGQGDEETDAEWMRRQQALAAAQSGGQNINVTPTETPIPAAVVNPAPASAPAQSSALAGLPTGYEDPAVQRNLAGEPQPPAPAGTSQAPPTFTTQPADTAATQGQPSPVSNIRWKPQPAPPGQASVGGEIYQDNSDGTSTLLGIYINQPTGYPLFVKNPTLAGGDGGTSPIYSLSAAGPAGTALLNNQTGQVSIIPNSQPVSSEIVNMGSAGYGVLNQSTGQIDAIPGSATGQQVVDASNAFNLAQGGYALTHPAVQSTGGGLLIPPGASVRQELGEQPGSAPSARGTHYYSGAPLPQEATQLAGQASRLANLSGLPPAGTNPQGAAAPAAAPAPAPSQVLEAPPPQAPTYTRDPDLARHLGTAGAVAATPSQDPGLAQHLGTAGAYFQPVPVLPLPDENQPGAGQTGYGSTPVAPEPTGTFMGRGLTARAGRGSSGVGWEPRLNLGAGHLGGRSSGMGGGRGGSGMSGGGGVGQDTPQPDFQQAYMLGAMAPQQPMALPPVLNQFTPIPMASDAEHSQPRAPIVAPQPMPMGMGQSDAQTADYPGRTLAGFQAGSPPQNQVAEYIRSAAQQRGIDPEVALAVANSEGGFDPRGWTGDEGSSYGPYQLHWGGVAPGGNRVGGMGDEFTHQTGIQMGDQTNWQPTVDYALDTASRQGWDPRGAGFHGATRAGIGNWQGIDRGATQLGGGQDMPPPGGPPGEAPGGWAPPVQPQDVQGIGHRFGQQMDVGTPQHEGVDLQASEGVPTQSPVDGHVLRVENNPEGLGITVVVLGLDGSEHQLGHLSHTDAYPGMVVKMGQRLGSVGSTGNTTGSHLHWGVKDGATGAPVDNTPALPPGMQNMPPVPGTEMMGPPGGTGGGAQMGAGVNFPPGQTGGQHMGSPGVGQAHEDIPNTIDIGSASPWNTAQRGAVTGGFAVPPGDDPNADLPVQRYQRNPPPTIQLDPGISNAQEPDMTGPPADTRNWRPEDTDVIKLIMAWRQQAEELRRQQEETERGLWQRGGPVASQSPGVQPPGHVANPGEIPMPGPMINTGPGVPVGPNIFVPPQPMPQGHQPGPEVRTPDVTTSSPWDPSLKDMLQWPKIQFPWDPRSGQPTGIYTETGSSGGSEQPEAPYPTTLPQHKITDQPGTGQDEGEVHQGLNAAGQTYAIHKPYAEMTPEEKDDANRYARQIGSYDPAAAAPPTPQVITPQGANPAAGPNAGNQYNNVADANTMANIASQQFQALLQAMVQLQQQAQSALSSMNQAGQSVLQQQGQQAFADWQTRQSDRLQILQSALNNPWLGMLSGLNPLPGQTGAPILGGSDPWGLNNILQPFDYQSWLQGSPYAPPPSQYGQAVGPSVGIDENMMPTTSVRSPTPGATTPPASPSGPGQAPAPASGAQRPLPPPGVAGVASQPSVGEGITHGAMIPAGPATQSQTAYPTGTASASPPPAGAIGNEQAWARQPQSWNDWMGMTPWQKGAYSAWFQNTYGPARWNEEQNRLHTLGNSVGASMNITPLQASTADQATLAGDVMNANVLGQSTPGWMAQQQKNWSAARAPSVRQAAGIGM